MQKLNSLKYLYLYENQIEKIPDSFLKLNLYSLYLQKNHLIKDDNFHKLVENLNPGISFYFD